MKSGTTERSHQRGHIVRTPIDRVTDPYSVSNIKVNIVTRVTPETSPHTLFLRNFSFSDGVYKVYTARVVANHSGKKKPKNARAHS